MARKRHSDEDCLKLLREIEVKLAGGTDVSTACRVAGISYANAVDVAFVHFADVSSRKGVVTVTRLLS